MTRSSRTLSAAAATLGAVLLLAGCGGSSTPSASGSSPSAASSSAAPASPTAAATPNGIADKEPKAILDAAIAAAKAQTSVHLVYDNAEQGGLDLHVTKDNGGYGTLTAQGSTVQLVVVGETVYLKGDKAFWENNLGPEAAAAIGDKWVQADPGGVFTGATDFGSLTTVIDGLLGSLGTPKKGKVGDIGGAPAVSVTTENGILWVATTGEPLPLEVDDAQGSGKATFSEWSAPVDVQVPPSDQVIQESALPVPSGAPSSPGSPAPTAS